jgi:4-oxalocrotonate tautomerase
MPHVIIKLYPGRTDTQKAAFTAKLVAALEEIFGAPSKSISVAFEEVAPENWAQDVYIPEIMAKEATLFKKPGYKPEGL